MLRANHVRPCQPPAPVEPARQDRHQEPGKDAQAPQSREIGDERGDHHGRAEADLQIAASPERAEARTSAQPAPATRDRLARRCVIKRGQEQQVASLVETEHREIDLFRRQQVDELGHAQRQNGVHVVLKPPLRQDLIHVGRADRRPVIVEVRVEIVVRDDEDTLVRVRLIVRFHLGVGLKPERRLATPLLAENQGRGRIGRTAEELVPRRMVNRRQAAPFEHGVRLGILLAERIPSDPVVSQELFELHPWPSLS